LPATTVRIDDVPQVLIARTPKLNSQRRVRVTQRISAAALTALRVPLSINLALLDITARVLRTSPPVTRVRKTSNIEIELMLL
jgi:hypothetical protein